MTLSASRLVLVRLTSSSAIGGGGVGTLALPFIAVKERSSVMALIWLVLVSLHGGGLEGFREVGEGRDLDDGREVL